eukprot:scaffold3946_cov177-Amphora_coffeaeformis.AAC.8
MFEIFSRRPSLCQQNGDSSTSRPPLYSCRLHSSNYAIFRPTLRIFVFWLGGMEIQAHSCIANTSERAN